MLCWYKCLKLLSWCGRFGEAELSESETFQLSERITHHTGRRGEEEKMDEGFESRWRDGTKDVEVEVNKPHQANLVELNCPWCL